MKIKLLIIISEKPDKEYDAFYDVFTGSKNKHKYGSYNVVIDEDSINIIGNNVNAHNIVMNIRIHIICQNLTKIWTML